MTDEQAPHPGQMRAFVNEPGQPLPQLTQRRVPRPSTDEVLVRVTAAALNNADLTPGPTRRIAGYEFAGEVLSAGSATGQPLVGQHVMGITDGAFAEYVTAHRIHVLAIPDGLSKAAAATLPTALTTEYGAIRRAGMRLGDTVLVTAATSSIALIGMQVARVLGAASIIGTTRSPARRDVVEHGGADEVVVTGEHDLAEAVLSLTHGTGADVVLDHIGGTELDQAIQATRTGGSVVSVGRLGGPTASIDLFGLARRAVRLQSVSYGLEPPAVLGDLFAGVARDVLPAISQGRITPMLDHIFAFDELHDAFRHAGSDARRGKVVLTFG